MITAAVVGAQRRLQGVHVAERQAAIAGQGRAEALDIGRIAGRVDGGVAAPVEGALEADDVDPLGLAVGPVMLARHLQGALHRLGPGVGEEDHVGEGGLAQAPGQPLLAGNAEDVGDVPELLGLVLQGGDEPRVGVAEARGGDAGQAVEIGLALGGVEPRPAPALEGQRRARIDGEQVVFGDGGFGGFGRHGFLFALKSKIPPGGAGARKRGVVFLEGGDVNVLLPLRGRGTPTAKQRREAANGWRGSSSPAVDPPPGLRPYSPLRGERV